MEYCSVSDLSVIIKKRDRLSSIHPCFEPIVRDYPTPEGSGLNEVLVRHWAKQLAAALEFLRKDGLVHRDVKPQNLLLNPPPDYDPETTALTVSGYNNLAGLRSLPVLKLADFGFARVLPAASMAETLCGSPLYMAPEILRYEKYDATADLWSVGTVLYELIAGRPPFRAPNHVDLLRKIEAQGDKISYPSSTVASRGLQSLVKGLLKRNPVERMGFDEFFGHEVIKGPIPDVKGVEKERRESIKDATIAEAMKRTSSTSSSKRGDAREQEDRIPQQQPHMSSCPRTRHLMGNSELPFATPTSEIQPSFPVSSRTPPPLPSSGHRQYSSRSPMSSSPRERAPTLQRPPMPAHTQTAPTREPEVQYPAQRPAARGGANMERVQSQPTSIPTRTDQLQLQERLSEAAKERLIGQEPSKDRRVAHRRTGSSLRSSEEDYVIVDKQQVQVNAFADEIGSVRRQFTPTESGRHGLGVSTALIQRPGTAGSSPRSQATAIATRNNRQDQFSIQTPPSSYDRQQVVGYPTSPSSAKSTLAKALEIANLRLFGSPVQHSPPNSSPPNHGAAGSLVVIGNNQPGTGAGMANEREGMTAEDWEAWEKIKDSGDCADVVYVFAQVKYLQIIPSDSAPVITAGLGLTTEAPTTGRQRSDSSLSSSDDAQIPSEDLGTDLTPTALIQTAEECLVLFVKVLSLLTKTTDTAAAWWSSPAPSPSSQHSRYLAGKRINGVIQWARDKFNEVLDKACDVQHRISDAREKLGQAGDMASEKGMYWLSTQVCAEKLMYDRALEMARTSAVNELIAGTKEEMAGCESGYVTALRLLEGCLARSADDPASDGVADEEDIRRVEASKFITPCHVVLYTEADS